MLLAREMPVNAVARHVGVTDKWIWRVVTHDILKAMGKLDLSRLCGIGLDKRQPSVDIMTSPSS